MRSNSLLVVLGWSVSIPIGPLDSALQVFDLAQFLRVLCSIFIVNLNLISTVVLVLLSMLVLFEIRYGLVAPHSSCSYMLVHI